MKNMQLCNSSENDIHYLIPANGFLNELKNTLKECLLELGFTPNQDIPIIEVNALLSRKEACSLLGISLPTLSKYVASGKLPYSRIGKKILFDKALLLQSCIVNQKK